MELKITGTKEQPLLFRQVVHAIGNADSVTPSKSEAQKIIAAELKCDEKLVVVKGIKTYFGLRKIDATAYKYNDEESLNKIEPKKKEKKSKAEQAQKQEEKK